MGAFCNKKKNPVAEEETKHRQTHGLGDVSAKVKAFLFSLIAGPVIGTCTINSNIVRTKYLMTLLFAKDLLVYLRQKLTSQHSLSADLGSVLSSNK